MKKAILPGSFDPVTFGHLDIIERSSKVFDKVYVVICENSEKQTMFSLPQRLQFLQHSTKHIANIECTYYQGVTIEYARTCGACAIIRGIRGYKDFEYEMDIAKINHHIDPNIETVFLYATPQYSHISSSMIKEMVQYHQDIRAFVNEEVAKAFDEY